ncbi:MAG TPA: PAS domain S-box protein [Acidobacterium sp.]|nr:PAS domain S-box protein [Acidobacterium sp.]
MVPHAVGRHPLVQIRQNNLSPLTSEPDPGSGSRAAERIAELEQVNEVLRTEIAALKDVESRLRASEESLKQSEVKLRQVIDTIPTLVWCNLPDGPNEFLNKKWLDYTGLSREEASGWGWQASFHPDDLGPLMKRWQELLITEEPGEIESRIRQHDGAWRWFLIRVEPFRDESGKVVRWYGTSTDIHDRKRTEEALRQSEEKYRVVIEAAHDSVISIDERGVVVFANPVVEMTFGYASAELVEKSISLLMPKFISRLREDCNEQQAEACEQHLNWKDVEFTAIHANGSEFPVEVSMGEVRTGEQRIFTCLIRDVSERRLSEEALRQSARSLRSLVDTIPGLVCTLSPDMRLEFSNHTLLDFFGKTVEELQNWEFIGVVHPDDLERTITKSRRAAETGEAYDIEHRCLRHDGVFRWFQVRALPVRGNEEQIVRWCVLLTDIEDRKLAEDALLASERKLSLIINTMPALAWSTQPDGSADFFNQTWIDYTGLSRDQAHGWGWRNVVHPEDASRLIGYWQRLIREGGKGEIEARFRRFDGEFRWFLFRANPLLDESGKIIKWYGTNTDIHDRKLVEEKVRLSEAFLADAQRLAHVGSFSWRLPANQIEWSEELYRIFEFEPGTPITFDLIGSRIHPEDLPLMYDKMGKGQDGVSNIEYEERLLMPNGSIKHLHLTAYLTQDENNTLRYIGTVHDITQRKAAEDALAEARAELAEVARVSSLGMLTASIAHEVNQPLSGIITNASTCLRMLSTDPPDVQGAIETARRTIRDGNRAADVISHLRSLFGRRQKTAEKVDVAEAIREVIAISLSDIQRNRIIIQESLAVGLPPIKGDRVQLQQVILNLLRNACEAMRTVQDRPRRIIIKTEYDRESIRLSMEDSGVGFKEELADRLFASFFTTKHNGMGIGLAVSRSIIQAHGGDIWAKPNEGPGATFGFWIPRSLEAEGLSGT